MEQVAVQMRVLNQTYKEMDEIFHNYAKANGLSDAVFGILYLLWDRGAPCPQRELCEAWCYPPQTINSALKALEKQGIVALVFAPESRKSKEIHLTGAGRALAQRVVVPFKQAEHSALLGLSECERETMVLTLKKHLSLFRQETDHVRILPLFTSFTGIPLKNRRAVSDWKPPSCPVCNQPCLEGEGVGSQTAV